jgi:RHS repeat-associated protein
MRFSIDEVLADEANGSVSWTLTDNLGSVRDVVDATGTSRNHVVFDSFGNLTSETNPSFDTQFSFTGREFDAETGNYDYRFRPFRPSNGHFLEEDPIGLMMQGEISRHYPRWSLPTENNQNLPTVDLNLYRYVGNNPINSTDPTGLYGQIDGARDPLRSIFFTTLKNGSKNQDFANDMKDVVRKRDKDKNFVAITEDVSFAIIVYSLVETGTDASSSPPDMRSSGDERGHIVAKQFGGRGIKNNLFAQDRAINGSQWFGYERLVRNYLDTHLLQRTDCGFVQVGLAYSVYLRGYPPNSLRPGTLASTARFSDGHLEQLPAVAN